MATAPNVLALMFGRFVVGLGVGIASMAVPVYLSEAAPLEIRGKLQTINILFVTTGQLISLLVCLSLGDHWRWMLGLAGVPAVLQFIGFMYLPETPSYLFKSGRPEEAQEVIKFIYKEEFIEDTAEEYRQEAHELRESTKLSYWNQYKQLFDLYRPCLVIGCGVQAIQQFAGINTVMYYGPTLLGKAGIGSNS